MNNLWELKLENEAPIARYFHMFPWHFNISIFIGRLLHLGFLSDTFFRNCFSHQMRYKHVNTNFCLTQDSSLFYLCSLHLSFQNSHASRSPLWGQSTLGWSVSLKTRQSRNHPRLSSVIWQIWALAYVISICNYKFSFVVSVLFSCPSFLKICHSKTC